METTFPDRCFLLIIFVFIVSMFVISGCSERKEYEIDPKPVEVKTVVIDSFFTTTEYIPTGDGDSLFSGTKGLFDSYALLKFDTIPGASDSVFMKLRSDSTYGELQFYLITNEWYEDSLYKWDDIGFIIDTSVVLQSSSINTKNPEIKLDGQSINAIKDYGIAIHSDFFYSFASREKNEPKLITHEGDSTFNVSCCGDLYIAKNPFDSLLKDTMMVGRGISVKPNLFIPVDSLPLERENFSRAGLSFKVDGTLSFSVKANDTSGNEYFNKSYTEGDTNFIEFNILKAIQPDITGDYIHITIGPRYKLNGIDAETLFNGQLKLMWAVIGRE